MDNYLGEMTAAADGAPSWTVVLSVCAAMMTDRSPTAPHIRTGQFQKQVPFLVVRNKTKH